jgi:PAS domain S-box-containing protein
MIACRPTVNESAQILVVDDDSVSRRVLADTLKAAGLGAVTLDSGALALSWLSTNRPAVILLDLLMPDPDGYAVLRHVRCQAHLADVPVVVLTALDSDEEIGRVFASGADDYVHKPFRPAELVARVRGQIRLRESVEQLNRRERDQTTVLELTQALASTFDLRETLHMVAARVADLANVDRCSIVLADEGSSRGYVLASSDDTGLRDLPIDLAAYPEIRHVLASGEPLVVESTMDHPVLERVREQVAHAGFVSMALLPVRQEHGAMGVIFLRSKSPTRLGDHEVSLITTLANATAIALRNARTLQSLRDESAQSSYARAEAERRVRLFQRYADFFESAADGMVVIDRAGRLLFANPRAREITGFSETELTGLCFEDLIVESERERARRLIRGFSEAVYPRSADVTLRTKCGQPIVASVSFSSVLHENNAVVFSFRDVTVERKTAIELKQTKEFLERVIDSSVDGIVSADMTGRVLLFNRAAERIFGYSQADVVGKLNISELYPPGVAQDVMRKMRDPDLDGYGRLESLRVDMVGAHGELIPVVLSAALVLENGEPVATVDVVTDIRERLRMEQTLLKAQEELQAHERQAIVAELAGAAAHELNQPLTSVLGYAELLRRSLEPNTNLHNAANVIINEAERMAEIVRKVGKITRYETKSYVGGAKILDIEKASGPRREED